MKEKVCKAMFLSTLGRKSDSRIMECLKSQRKTFEDSICPIDDGRGKAEPKAKKDIGIIKEHLNSYNPAICHYKKESCPKRRYLNPELNVKKMWDDFHSKFPDGGGYQLYFKAFKDENIGFSTPSVDDCKLCLDNKCHIAALGDNCHDSDSCDICIEKKEHQRCTEKQGRNTRRQET